MRNRQIGEGNSESGSGAGLTASGKARRRIAVTVAAATIGLTVSWSASAVDGCEVLLCLAAPNGWSGISQCVPPMEQFLKDMAMGKAFPSCSMAGNPKTKTGSYAQPMPSNYYNECPAGTQALAQGAFAIMSATAPPAASQAARAAQQQLLAGIGDGSQFTASSAVPVSSMPPEICVSGAPIGVVSVPMNLGNLRGLADVGVVSIAVPVYSTVTILQPNTSNNVIGVWIDGQLYNQVHW